MWCCSAVYLLMTKCTADLQTWRSLSNSAVLGTLGQPSCACLHVDSRLQQYEYIVQISSQARDSGLCIWRGHKMLIHHKIPPSQMIISCPWGFMPWNKHHSSCSFLLGMQTSGSTQGTDGWKDKEKGAREYGGRKHSFASCTTTRLSLRGRDHLCLFTAALPHLA